MHDRQDLRRGNVLSSRRKSIGDGNISFTRSWLEREGIALVSSDFGGRWARQLVFQLEPIGQALEEDMLVSREIVCLQ